MDKNNIRNISGYSSVFLDSLRLCAALTVLYIHATDQWFPTQKHISNQPGEPSHAAVIVFFALSGYVIAFTTANKNRGKIQYIKARLSRLCSMLIPALLITASISITLKFIDPIMLASYSRGGALIRYVLSGLFLNEIWFFSAAPPINGPIWSLSFEFWYYMIFGFWFFKQSGLKSYILPFLICLIAGPKILLLMPIWLFGYWAYHIKPLRIKKQIAWILVIIFLGLTCMIVETLIPYPYLNGLRPLYFANQFVTDWIVGFFIAIVLWLLPNEEYSPFKNKMASIFRYLADFTFPIYIMHFPLMVLTRSLLGNAINSSFQMWSAIIIVIVISVLIGAVLDKQRPVWNRFFDWMFSIKL